MNRRLQYFNLIGILALAALCAIQWQTNRKANLEVIRLEKNRLEQASTLAGKEKLLKGSAADLEAFRHQLIKTHEDRNDLETKLAVATHENHQLIAERDALKQNVSNWVAAVATRDERLHSANAQVEQLSTDRNQTVVKFNQLADKYNSVVKSLDEARAQLAAAQGNLKK